MAEDQVLPEPAELQEFSQADYFGTDEIHKLVLPDNVSYFEHQTLNEGARKKYLDKTNRDISVNRQTGDMKLKMAAGSDRHELIKLAVVNWNLARGGVPVPFSKPELDRWLEVAPPHIVDLLERDIRSKNKWLNAEMTLDDIAAQRKELDELEQQIIEREAGKAS